MTKKDFNELVYEFGASGTKAIEHLSKDEQDIILEAWAVANVEDENNDVDFCDKIINSYYADFQRAELKANGKNKGLGYHNGGRPRKDAEARRVTICISGTPSEIEELKMLATREGVTVSRYVLDKLK